MSGYILGDDAVLDLEAIWDYIARDSIDAADRWIAKLFETFEALGQTPGMGHKREDLTRFPHSLLARRRIPRHLPDAAQSD